MNFDFWSNSNQREHKSLTVNQWHHHFHFGIHHWTSWSIYAIFPTPVQLLPSSHYPQHSQAVTSVSQCNTDEILSTLIITYTPHFTLLTICKRPKMWPWRQLFTTVFERGFEKFFKRNGVMVQYHERYIVKKRSVPHCHEGRVRCWTWMEWTTVVLLIFCEIWDAFRTFISTRIS